MSGRANLKPAESESSNGQGDQSIPVLVVDDYSPALYARSRALEKEGFTVLQATTGNDALRIVTERKPALVVLDVKLPDIDGIAVCRQIKENPATANTMVLQVSAYYTSIEDQVYGLDSGADAYLPGDIHPALLVSAARALLRMRRAEQTIHDQDERLWMAKALEKSREELRALSAALLTAQDDERRRISRDLHDNFCQRLAVVEMQMRALQGQSPDLCDDLDRLATQVASLSRELTNLSHLLYPKELEDLGLPAALGSLCEEFERAHNIPVDCAFDIDDQPVPLATATAFYRIVQAALRNVAQHAGDARVKVRLSAADRELCLVIADDGRGFDPEVDRHQPSLGLTSMQERTVLIGGHLELHSAPGKGTTIEVRAPLQG